MRILYAASADSIHTKKFCDYFSRRGFDVHVLSFTYGTIDSAEVKVLRTGAASEDGEINKLKYLTATWAVSREIRRLKPDIVHAHYASSYGGTMALTGIKNYILSVWGSDVYSFPRRSFMHRKFLEFSLRRAGYIFSTSRAMADETRKYTSKKIYITPFGVDMNLFSPAKRTRPEDDSEFVMGTVKTLAPTYGIEYLIKAAKLITDRRPDIPLRVRIAGNGPSEEKLRHLVRSLNLGDTVSFLGYVSQQRAAQEFADMDVAVIPSESESFGVSAVEAASCGTAVVISDIPGLMEATSPGVSSVVVPRHNAEAIAEAVIRLYDDKAMRLNLGKNGRKFVAENYEYNMCFEKIEGLYHDLLEGKL